MSASGALVRLGIRALRRSTLWWGIGIVALVLVTAAFWPSLEGSDALTNLDDMGSLLEAFGAQNIATPAGYLDGQIYALMLPLLLAGMAIAGISALTSGDEDAGRLEFIHALPVTRRAVWLGRWSSTMVALVLVAVAATVVMTASLFLFSFDGVGVGSIVGATFGCALLAAFHASVAYAAGGRGWSRGGAVGAAVLVLVAGYVLNFLVPLVDSLSGARFASPWYWAIGAQPVTDGIRPGGVLLLAVVTAALVWFGTRAVDHRDIRAA